MRLHVILFLALVLVSALPVLVLSVWVQQSALEQEYDAVAEKHLVIANNMSGVFTRYVADVREGFRVAVDSAAMTGQHLGFDKFLKSLNFCNLNIYKADLSLGAELMDPPPGHPRAPSLSIIREMKALIAQSPGKVIITDVMRDEGHSYFFLGKAITHGGFAVGMLTPEFIRQSQKSIAFGQRGHSMVVDSKGIVIAHPNPEWERTAKDASKLSVVKKMMAGQTGVSEFYSPPMQADMIAGHTAVPGVGWGVMVPQPIEELRIRAADVRLSTALIAIAGMLLAIILSWWLSCFLARPIVAIDTAALNVANGRLDTRVNLPEQMTPLELKTLAAAFNKMVEQLAERERNFLVARDQALVADKTNSEFLANISHELRTPLNAIIGFADVISEQTLGPVGTPKYIEYVRDIKQSGEHLVEVINDVLDMSRIEAGQLQPQFGEVEISEIVKTCSMMISDRARLQNINIDTNLPDNALMLYADSRMMKQVLLNLLSNAVKFTPDGGAVKINVETGIDFGCRITVSDTGIGIEPDMIAAVMEPFVQAETNLERKYEGTGLGLPLVKSMVEMHGGTIKLESTPGKGTAALIHLPPVG